MPKLIPLKTSPVEEARRFFKPHIPRYAKHIAETHPELLIALHTAVESREVNVGDLRKLGRHFITLRGKAIQKHNSLLAEALAICQEKNTKEAVNLLKTRVEQFKQLTIKRKRISRIALATAAVGTLLASGAMQISSRHPSELPAVKLPRNEVDLNELRESDNHLHSRLARLPERFLVDFALDYHRLAKHYEKIGNQRLADDLKQRALELSQEAGPGRRGELSAEQFEKQLDDELTSRYPERKRTKVSSP